VHDRRGPADQAAGPRLSACGESCRGRRTSPLRTVRLIGQLAEPDAIQAAITGSDALISAPGPSRKPGGNGTPRTDGARVVAAMPKAGVRRFVGPVTPSIPDPRDRPTLSCHLWHGNALTNSVGDSERCRG